MVIRIICIIIGCICLYNDISSMQKPDHMQRTLRDIAPVVQDGVVH